MAMNIERASKIDGWMSEEELLWLATQAADKRDILEIGSWRGRSTRALCDNTIGSVTVIDTFLGAANTAEINVIKESGDFDLIYNEFKENMKDKISGKNANCSILRMLSENGMALLYKHQAKFDMIFIDGDHSFKAVKHDVLMGLLLLKQGGLLCGHDWPFVKGGAEDALKKYNIESPVGSIWVKGKMKG